MEKVLVFLHGDMSDLSSTLSVAGRVDMVICADGGAQHALDLGMDPDVVIGDFDSLSPDTKLPDHTRKIPYPREKDFTDAELAFTYAIDRGAQKIYVCGFMGRRFDHMMGNLLYIQTLNADIEIIEGNQIMRFIRKEAEFTGAIGDELSLIPLSAVCKGVSTKGLKYKLVSENLPLGTTRGISNVFMDFTASIKIKQGTLLAIHRSL